MAHETVKLLANDDLAMIPIRLYLQGVSYLQNCNYDGAVDLCYEFFTQVRFSTLENVSENRSFTIQMIRAHLI